MLAVGNQFEDGTQSIFNMPGTLVQHGPCLFYLQVYQNLIDVSVLRPRFVMTTAATEAIWPRAQPCCGPSGRLIGMTQIEPQRLCALAVFKTGIGSLATKALKIPARRRKLLTDRRWLLISGQTNT